MKYSIRKIDVIIVIILLLTAGFVLFQSGIIKEPGKPTTPIIIIEMDDENNTLTVKSTPENVLWIDIIINGNCDRSSLSKYVIPGDILSDCRKTITLIYNPTGEEIGTWTFTEKEKLSTSIIPGYMRSLTPEDEGDHFNLKLIGEEFFREWWYYTAIFDNECDLPEWSITISFNHMARNDLFISKPDMLFILLHSPDGKEYGGIIERERPVLGILNEPSLQAASSRDGFKISFENSYVKGKFPNWHIHIEGEKIDNEIKLVIDLQFFAPSDPYWLHFNRPIGKSKGRMASYVFLGCEVTGMIIFDNLPFTVDGIGHHEHTWSSGILTKSLMKGWDWCNMKLNNGWQIYYSNYYITSQLKDTKTYNVDTFSNVIITTDNGRTLTILNDVTIDILESEKISLILSIPTDIKITAIPDFTQILRTYDIEMELDIKVDTTFDKVWNLGLTKVGMKIGRSNINGKISWSDEEGSHLIELNGIASVWHMRH
jgi:predicted secreted hydrolase